MYYVYVPHTYGTLSIDLRIVVSEAKSPKHRDSMAKMEVRVWVGRQGFCKSRHSRHRDNFVHRKEQHSRARK